VNIAVKTINNQREETAHFMHIEAFHGIKLLCRVWVANAKTHSQNQVNNVVVYLPGIEGHGNWFEDTALWLSNHGITTYAIDRRGSGLSEGISGHLDSYKQLLHDIEIVITKIKKDHPLDNIFLVANCWSAKAAVILANESESVKSIISGLILTSPALYVKADVKLWTKLEILWRFIFGSKKAIDIPLSESDFTDNPYYIDYILHDTLRLRQATAQFFIESTKLSFLALSKAKKLKLPLLVLQAGLDSIVSVNKIKCWFDLVESKDKAMHVFENVCHSLDFSADPSEYRQILLNWLCAHNKQMVTSK
jgi:alpha-beta hydrolase superfamily lysophospholipase